MRSDPTGIFILLFAALGILGLTLRSYHTKLQRRETELSSAHQKITSITKAHELLQQQNTDLADKHARLQQVLNETSTFYPSLAQAIADFNYLELMKQANHLDTKPRPAHKTADTIREAARLRRETEKRFHVLRYQLSYYEAAFPWITEISGKSTEELLSDLESQFAKEEANTSDQDKTEDARRQWLSNDEWKRLTSAEKSDLALERWRKSRKTNWEIGREYERAIGHSLEMDGYKVEYTGAIQGFEDMGRDLIAKKGSTTLIVQCKYWREERLIHEKHIFQLIGTALEYASSSTISISPNTNLKQLGIVPILITSTKLSDLAKRCAQLMGVITEEHRPLTPYPSIKCNISGRNGEKIYHLPFDQQYDSTRIDPEKGEFYLSSAIEAENRGFRRAMRHRTS